MIYNIYFSFFVKAFAIPGQAVDDYKYRKKCNYSNKWSYTSNSSHPILYREKKILGYLKGGAPESPRATWRRCIFQGIKISSQYRDGY